MNLPSPEICVLDSICGIDRLATLPSNSFLRFPPTDQPIETDNHSDGKTPRKAWPILQVNSILD